MADREIAEAAEHLRRAAGLRPGTRFIPVDPDLMGDRESGPVTILLAEDDTPSLPTLIVTSLHYTPGAAAIAAERDRQVAAEGFTPAADDAYTLGELALAAGCYLDAGPVSATVPAAWPFDPAWWKPAGRVRDLEKAGALIAAEIDRLRRQEQGT